MTCPYMYGVDRQIVVWADLSCLPRFRYALATSSRSFPGPQAPHPLGEPTSPYAAFLFSESFYGSIDDSESSSTELYVDSVTRGHVWLARLQPHSQPGGFPAANTSKRNDIKDSRNRDSLVFGSRLESDLQKQACNAANFKLRPAFIPLTRISTSNPAQINHLPNE